jgi:ferric-dicitrate binding protein FerR (iron transport regulator)
MTDRDRRAQELLEELFPAPEPPRDMAARVLAALDRQRSSPPPLPRQPAPPPLVLGAWPAQRPRRARPWLLGAAAAALLAAVWGGVRGLPEWNRASQERSGHLIATDRQTVNIGTRAAAAAEPGAEVAWSLEGQRARVDQRGGSVFYRVNRGGPFHVVTPSGEIEVTGTCFRVAATPGAAGQEASTLVSVLEGSVNVRTDAGRLAITIGQSARLVRGRAPLLIPAPAPAAEQLQGRLAKAEERLQQLETQLAEQQRERPRRPAALLLPYSSRVRVHADRGGRLREVSLALRSAGGTPPGAVVEVARDAGFRRQIWSGVAEDDFVTVPAPSAGDLYWRRVDGGKRRAGQGGNDGSAGHARFLIDEPSRVGASATHHNEVTDRRETTTIYFQGAPPALTLTYAPVPGAQRYRVRVYGADALADPIVEKVVTGTRCEIGPGVLGEGSYVWNALPLDQNGEATGGGRMSNLSLVYDNAVESLALTQLGASRARGKGGRRAGVDVAGVAPLGARLYLNGRAAALDDKGRFSLHLPGAENLLVFRVVARDGAESYWVKAVEP